MGILGLGLGFLILLLVLAFLRELGPYALALGLMFGFWWLLLQVLVFGIARPVATRDVLVPLGSSACRAW